MTDEEKELARKALKIMNEDPTLKTISEWARKYHYKEDGEDEQE